MPTGTVKFFNLNKGYGFIGPDNGDPDVFVHIIDVQDAGMDMLVKGLRLSFDLAMGSKGQSKAVNLRLL